MELLQLNKIITFSGYRIAKYGEYMVLFVQLKKVYVTKMFCIVCTILNRVQSSLHLEIPSLAFSAFLKPHSNFKCILIHLYNLNH